MFVLLFLFILPQNSFADKYDHAIKTATTAAAKQSGLESDFLKLRAATNKEVTKWARKNGLEIPLTVISFVAPVVYKKQMRFKTGDFTFKGTSSKVTLDWQFQF